MKKIKWILLTGFILILAACGNDNDEVVVSDTNNGQTNSELSGAIANINELDFDVDYAGNKSYQVSYEKINNTIEVEIENELDGKQKLTGQQALDELNNKTHQN